MSVRLSGKRWARRTRAVRPVFFALILFLSLPISTRPAFAADLAPPSLNFVRSVEIAKKSSEFVEPSGLSLNEEGTGFWSVSDNEPALYTLPIDGKPYKAQKLSKHLDGLEGIAFDRAEHRLLMVREDSTEIIAISLNKKHDLSRHPLKDMKGYEKIATQFERGGSNNGLEGIEVDPRTGSVLLVKESQPRMMIEVSSDLSTISGALLLTAELGFMDEGVKDHTLDVSGLAFDPSRNAYWISSDTGRRVFLFEPRGAHAYSYPLLWEDEGHVRRVENAEGVAVSADGKRLWLVTDDQMKSRLYEYAVE